MPLLSALIPSGSADVVAVFDQTFKQLFSTARPLKITVKEEKKVMQHPIETGEVIADHAVIQPVNIELSVLLQGRDDYRSVYQEIRTIFLNNTIIIVQTRTGTYSNMVISAMPHDETPEQFDMIAIAVKLEEALFVTPKTGKLPPAKVKDKKKASTVDAGVKQPKPASPSALIKFSDFVAGFR